MADRVLWVFDHAGVTLTQVDIHLEEAAVQLLPAPRASGHPTQHQVVQSEAKTCNVSKGQIPWQQINTVEGMPSLITVRLVLYSVRDQYIERHYSSIVRRLRENPRYY